jgi:hypothetical protein
MSIVNNIVAKLVLGNHRKMDDTELLQWSGKLFGVVYMNHSDYLFVPLTRDDLKKSVKRGETIDVVVGPGINPPLYIGVRP